MSQFFFLVVLIVAFGSPLTCFAAEPLFHSQDPLAARDEHGLLHQNPVVNETDFARRHPCRFMYYFESGKGLTADPAYVGALQDALRRRGYYCGEIDGVFSEDVSDAIARMQKNYSQRVTGTLTIPVRRALHLP